MDWEFLEKQPLWGRLLAIFAFLTSIWFAETRQARRRVSRRITSTRSMKA